MKSIVSKYMAFCLVALSGYYSANASPTYQSFCFETEKAAEKHKSFYEYREVDNSETAKTDALAGKFTLQEVVKLSDVENVLGEAQVTVDEVTGTVTHEWILSYIGSPSADPIRYDSSNGYCVHTRPAGHGIVTYTFKAEAFDKTSGTLKRFEMYI